MHLSGKRQAPSGLYWALLNMKPKKKYREKPKKIHRDISKTHLFVAWRNCCCCYCCCFCSANGKSSQVLPLYKLKNMANIESQSPFKSALNHIVASLSLSRKTLRNTIKSDQIFSFCVYLIFTVQVTQRKHFDMFWFFNFNYNSSGNEKCPAILIQHWLGQFRET